MQSNPITSQGAARASAIWTADAAMHECLSRQLSDMSGKASDVGSRVKRNLMVARADFRN
jgi:hypothetical protein